MAKNLNCTNSTINRWLPHVCVDKRPARRRHAAQALYGHHAGCAVDALAGDARAAAHQPAGQQEAYQVRNVQHIKHCGILITYNRGDFETRICS